MASRRVRSPTLSALRSEFREVELRCRSRPEADQFLAAGRDALLAMEAFYTLPPWRFWERRRRCRAMRDAVGLFMRESDRLRAGSSLA